MSKHFFQYCYRSVIVALGTISLSSIAMADGQADLRNALKQLQSTEPVAADVNFKLFGSSGEHDDLIEREGVIDLRVQDGPKGLQVTYKPELVAQLHAEELAKVDDENVKNSALNAIGQFEYWEWRELLYPAAQLELALLRYKFVDEKSDELDGRAARLLTFQLPLDKVDQKYRKYIKKYDNQLRLWIDEKGVPLASQITESGSGRVFVVVGFKFDNGSQTLYRKQGSRLLVARREVKEETSGAAMQSQRHFISTLTPVNSFSLGTSN